MKAIQACNPQSSTFLDATSLKPLTENYDLNHASLSIEAKLAKRTLASDVQNLEMISDVIKSVYPLRQAFPTLLKLALTICVTSAQCERCFSALKRIKTYLRSTMTEQRLAILSIERDMSQKLKIDDIIDKFALSDRNRRITLFFNLILLLLVLI